MSYLNIRRIQSRPYHSLVVLDVYTVVDLYVVLYLENKPEVIEDLDVQRKTKLWETLT